MCSNLFEVPANKQTQELPSPFEKNILDSLWQACLAEAAVLFVVPTQYSMEHLRQLCASALPALTRIGIPKFLKKHFAKYNIYSNESLALNLNIANV